MPCQSYSDAEYLQQAHEELDRLSRFLCEALAFIESEHGNIDSLKEAGVKAWWREHQEHDRKRKERERREAEAKLVKLAALKKLSIKERKALGL